MLEYEIYYRLTDEFCNKRHIDNTIKKIYVKGKNETVIKERACILIAEMNGCNLGDIIIEDMLYFDEYGDD